MLIFKNIKYDYNLINYLQYYIIMRDEKIKWKQIIIIIFDVNVCVGVCVYMKMNDF